MPEKDQTSKTPKQVIDPMMLSALVCPKTRGSLTYDKDANELISKKAKLAFPMRLLTALLKERLWA